MGLLLEIDGSAIATHTALAIIIICALYGFANGFFKALVRVFGTIIALLLAVYLSKELSLFLENKYDLITYFSDKISNILEEIFGTETV